MLLKTTSLTLALAILTAACMRDRLPPPPPATAPPSPATTVASARAPSIDPRLVALQALHLASATDAAAASRFYAESATKRFGEGTELHGRAAIEASARAEIAKLGKPTYGVSRAWTKANTLIVEDVTGASVNGRTVGVRGMDIYWFGESGLIERQHQYRNDPDLDAQIAGDPDAPKPVSLPASMETHATEDASDDAASAAWVGRFDLAWTQGADAIAPYLADDVTFLCTLGVDDHGKLAYLQTAREFDAKLLNQTVTIDHVWAVDDFLITEETLGATGAKSGKPLTLHFGEIFHVRDGKLVNDWAFGDGRNFTKTATP